MSTAPTRDELVDELAGVAAGRPLDRTADPVTWRYYQYVADKLINHLDLQPERNGAEGWRLVTPWHNTDHEF